MKLHRIAILLLPLFLVALAVPARAEGEEGAGGDLKEKIKKKMEGILELMKQNEAALLRLSTGKSAQTTKVEVEVPDQPPSGASGSEGSSGAAGASGSKGTEIGEKLDELIKGQREGGGQIPDQLKQLVEMIPL